MMKKRSLFAELSASIARDEKPSRREDTHLCEPIRRTISECVALLPEDSTAVVDPDFGKDVEIAVNSHRERLEPPAEK